MNNELWLILRNSEGHVSTFSSTMAKKRTMNFGSFNPILGGVGKFTYPSVNFAVTSKIMPRLG